MSHHHYGKPETALRRTEDLLTVGQRSAAYQYLHNVLTHRRPRTAWQPAFEKVFFKYVDLAIEFRKPLKEALIQYRSLCQHTNISSLEVVITYFLEHAEKRANAAQEQAQQTVLDIDDLEEESPESIILSAVSGEDSKERKDREILTPWLKYLWEAYKTILDVLRNNLKLDTVYRKAAGNAFRFCKRFNRINEFRRLSELLRNHLTHLMRNPQQLQALSNPETLQLLLETRFEQLKTSAELTLWQEGYRTVEDIHRLLNIGKKNLQPHMLAIYYEKLIEIFWVSDNHLFHAYAILKLYNTTQSKMSAEEATSICSNIVMAALAIPPHEKNREDSVLNFDVEKERHLRMASLLGFTSNPKRSDLLEEISTRGILELCLPEVQQLYSVLERDFSPLKVVKTAQPLLDSLDSNAKLARYRKLLERVMLLRLFQQLSKVYSKMRLAKFQQLVPFMTFPEIERMVVQFAKQQQLFVRIDHKNQLIEFTEQGIETSTMRKQLTDLSTKLQQVVDKIRPRDHSAQKEQERHQLFQQVLSNVESEHQETLARKAQIELRKKRYEQYLLKQEQAKEAQSQEAQRAKKEQEEARLQAETKRRQEERQKKEAEEKKKKEVATLVEEIKKSMPKNKAAKKLVEKAVESENVDRNLLIQAQYEARKKEQQDRDKRLREAFKNLDHTERARRETEGPMLDAWHKQKREQDREWAMSRFEFYKAKHLQNWTNMQADKTRLEAMVDFTGDFVESIKQRRQEHFEREKAAQAERMAYRERVLAEREHKRRIEEERRAAEEHARQLQEEEDRIQREKMLAEEAERRRKREEEMRAHNEKLALQAQKQAEREAEIERRDRERQGLPAAAPHQPSSSSTEAAAPTAASASASAATARDTSSLSELPSASGKAWRPKSLQGRASAESGDAAPPQATAAPAAAHERDLSMLRDSDRPPRRDFGDRDRDRDRDDRPSFGGGRRDFGDRDRDRDEQRSSFGGGRRAGGDEPRSFARGERDPDAESSWRRGGRGPDAGAEGAGDSRPPTFASRVRDDRSWRLDQRQAQDGAQRDQGDFTQVQRGRPKPQQQQQQ